MVPAIFIRVVLLLTNLNGDLLNAAFTQRINSSNVTQNFLINSSLEDALLSGIDPDLDLNSFKLNDSEIQKRLQEQYSLMLVANYFKNFLYETNLLENILIIDIEGYLLSFSKTEKDSVLAANGISLGINFGDGIIGTNGLGLALKHQVPVEVKGEKHYLNSCKKLTSFGVPIFRNDVVIGAAGFLQNIRDTRPLKNNIMKEVLQTSLSVALNYIKTMILSDEINLIKDVLQDPTEKALLVINADYDIVEINPIAEIYLNIHRNDFIGKPIINYFPKEHFNKNQDTFLRLAFSNLPVNTEFDVLVSPVANQHSNLIGWRLEFAKNDHKKIQFKDIIGQNREFIKAIKFAKTVAKSTSTVLLTGESGTGKELFAHSIHNASKYANGPFITVNCASIPKDLIESELFGYYDGAFTGAKKGGMQGMLIKANNGTLFLDEIGDMPLESQTKLLKVLQDRIVIPLGEGKPLPINIRVIAATNQDLEDLIQQKLFRLDLYYRINVIHIVIPPLRERQDDIPLLVKHFINIFRLKINSGIKSISEEALNCLKSYNWPGNVRELENVVEAAFNIAEDEIILPYHLPPNLNEQDIQCTFHYDDTGFIPPLEKIVEEAEREHIIKALKMYDSNISQVAQALGIGRGTLYRKIEKFSLLNMTKKMGENS